MAKKDYYYAAVKSEDVKKLTETRKKFEAKKAAAKTAEDLKREADELYKEYQKTLAKTHELYAKYQQVHAKYVALADAEKKLAEIERALAEAEELEDAKTERKTIVEKQLAKYTGPKKAWSYTDENGDKQLVLSYSVAAYFTSAPEPVPVWVEDGKIERILGPAEAGSFDW